jgi:hypothetical protein
LAFLRRVVEFRDPAMASVERNIHLPPHLREVCQILARGIVRLRSRSIAAISAESRGCGESSLPATPHQRRHANPEETEDA